MRKLDSVAREYQDVEWGTKSPASLTRVSWTKEQPLLILVNHLQIAHHSTVPSRILAPSKALNQGLNRSMGLGVLRKLTQNSLTKTPSGLSGLIPATDSVIPNVPD